MNILVSVISNTELQDETHTRVINTTSRNITCKQDPRLSLSELVTDSHTTLLGQSRVDLHNFHLGKSIKHLRHVLDKIRGREEYDYFSSCSDCCSMLLDHVQHKGQLLAIRGQDV
jgi:hypothetical protein